MAGPKVNIKLQVVPVTTVRSGVSGEFLKTLGMTHQPTMQGIQQAVLEGLVESIVVVAFNLAQVPKERYTLRMDAITGNPTIKLDLSGDKSYTEALDTGLAGMVAFISTRLITKKFTPKFYFVWSAYANANPGHLHAAAKRLGLAADQEMSPDLVPDLSHELVRPPSPPVWEDTSYRPPAAQPAMFNQGSYKPDGYMTYVSTSIPLPPINTAYKPVMTVTPAKDKGLSLTMEGLVKT